MNRPRIVPCRALVSPRFPDASFIVQVPRGAPFEVACATDRRLFTPGNAALRRPHSFFAGRGARAWAGEAVWILPATALRRMAPAPRLYYLAAAPGIRGAALSARRELAPWLRLAPDLPRSGRFGAPLAADAGVRWAGDLALEEDGFEGDGFGDGEEEGPPPLAKNQVVAIEVRDERGAVSPGYSHEYPVKPDPTAGEEGGVVLRLPGLPPFRSRELSLVQLRKDVQAALVTARILSSATVNASLTTKGVAYEQAIAPGTTLWVRILGSGGALEKASGAYPVNDAGEVDLPYLGLVKLAGVSLGEAEAALVERAAAARQFQGAVIDLSLEELR